jgi:hypothetical protein
MPDLLKMLKSLGNEGAVANVGAVLDERERERWIVDSLALQLERREPVPSASSSTVATA